MDAKVETQELSQPFLDFVLSHVQVTTYPCTRQEWDTEYVLAPRTVPDHNYIFVRRGNVVWTIENKPWTLNAGDLLVVPPGRRHHARGMPGHLLFGSIHVDLTLPGGKDVFDLLVPARVRRVTPGTRLDGYLANAIAEWSRQDERMTTLMMPSWVRLITLELLRHDAELGLLRQRAVDPLVGAILEELNARLDRRTSLADLAAWSGFSPQHMNRVFRRVLGVTPLQYLARMRMERAGRMLAEGGETVRGVARTLGFEDPYYFSRLFKQHFGRSPSQYRDNAQPRSGGEAWH